MFNSSIFKKYPSLFFFFTFSSLLYKKSHSVVYPLETGCSFLVKAHFLLKFLLCDDDFLLQCEVLLGDYGLVFAASTVLSKFHKITAVLILLCALLTLEEVFV